MEIARMENKDIRQIIWDWNGTLLNDAWLCVEVMNSMLSERNLPLITLEKYRNIFNFPVKAYYELLGYDFASEPFEEVGMEFMILYNRRQKECTLHNEVLDILKEISRRGYQQSILSAREENELRQETIDLGVAGFFERIYGLDDHYAHGKTDVGIKLLSDIGSPKKDFLFIGDTCHDAEVADELGIGCILIPNGHHSPERLQRCGKRLMLSLKELLTIL